jgi:hypothetical protein
VADQNRSSDGAVDSAHHRACVHDPALGYVWKSAGWLATEAGPSDKIVTRRKWLALGSRSRTDLKSFDVGLFAGGDNMAIYWPSSREIRSDDDAFEFV